MLLLFNLIGFDVKYKINMGYMAYRCKGLDPVGLVLVPDIEKVVNPRYTAGLGGAGRQPASNRDVSVDTLQENVRPGQIQD